MSEIIKQSMADIWASIGDVVAPAVEKIAEGWLVEVVPRQYWNWMQNRTDVNLAYMLQHGIPEWDAITEFIANKSYVQHAGIVYKAILTGINQNPVTATMYWKVAFVTSTAALEALKETAPSADKLPYFNSATTATTTTITPLARTLLDDTTQGEMLTTVGAQPLDATLTAIAGVTTATNKLPYFSGVDTATVTDLSAFGRSLIDDVNAGTARATLGLGTIATQDANAVTISGGSITGITDLAIADGGTGASNAATARTNLGLGSASTATVTTSTTDTTAGRVLKVGDFGVGGAAAVTTNFNQEFAAGRYYNADPSNTGLPYADYWMLEHLTSYQASVFSQRAVGVGGNLGKTFCRSTVTGVAALSPWVEVATSANSLGQGQTWQNMINRALGVTYTNTAGRPIEVSVTNFSVASGSVYLRMFINGVQVSIDATPPYADFQSYVSASMIVPNGATYSADNAGANGTLAIWSELR